MPMPTPIDTADLLARVNCRSLAQLLASLLDEHEPLLAVLAPEPRSAEFHVWERGGATPRMKVTVAIENEIPDP